MKTTKKELEQLLRDMLAEYPDPRQCRQADCVVCPRLVKLWNRARALFGLPLLTAVLLLVGCGPGEARYQCPPVEHLGWIESEMPVSCAAFAADASAAFRLLNSFGVVPEGSNHDFERVTVVVRDASPLPGLLNGHYDFPTQTIYLERSGGALFHEMVHHWKAIHGDSDTSHSGWCADRLSGDDGRPLDCDQLTLDERFWEIHEDVGGPALAP